MFYAEFVFANRRVRNPHGSVPEAVEQAQHTLANWQTISEVKILGDRRDGYPVLETLTRS